MLGCVRLSERSSASRASVCRSTETTKRRLVLRLVVLTAEEASSCVCVRGSSSKATGGTAKGTASVCLRSGVAEETTTTSSCSAAKASCSCGSAGGVAEESTTSCRLGSAKHTTSSVGTTKSSASVSGSVATESSVCRVCSSETTGRACVATKQATSGLSSWRCGGRLAESSESASTSSGTTTEAAALRKTTVLHVVLNSQLFEALVLVLLLHCDTLVSAGGTSTRAIFLGKRYEGSSSCALGGVASGIRGAPERESRASVGGVAGAKASVRGRSSSAERIAGRRSGSTAEWVVLRGVVGCTETTASVG